jgi:hypothetical protein
VERRHIKTGQPHIADNHEFEVAFCVFEAFLHNHAVGFAADMFFSFLY